jgi:hypothetical protein
MPSLRLKLGMDLILILVFCLPVNQAFMSIIIIVKAMLLHAQLMAGQVRLLGMAPLLIFAF